MLGREKPFVPVFLCIFFRCLFFPRLENREAVGEGGVMMVVKWRDVGFTVQRRRWRRRVCVLVARQGETGPQFDVFGEGGKSVRI